jgi:hypothetical protein
MWKVIRGILLPDIADLPIIQGELNRLSKSMGGSSRFTAFGPDLGDGYDSSVLKNPRTKSLSLTSPQHPHGLEARWGV